MFNKVIRGGGNRNKERSKPLSVGGFTNYQLVHRGKTQGYSDQKQEDNTSMFTQDLIRDVKPVCHDLKNVIEFVQSKFRVEIFKMHLLKQSSTGKLGAREALFDWHKDNVHDDKNSFLSVIVNLTCTKTSMQIAGFKEFHYDGIGNTAIFYSGLEHRSCYSEDGTMKLAMFCAKKKDFTLDVMMGNNIYPPNMIITRTTLSNVPDEYKKKLMCYTFLKVSSAR